MQRIVVIGTTGSGKSTFGGALAVALGAKHVELDDLHWLPDWRERADDEFRALVRAEAQTERWVAVGNYTVVRDVLWPRADTVIWIDLPFPITAWRLMRRTYRRIFKGELCCNGNRESMRRSLSHDSILLWLLKTYWKNRQRYPDILATEAADKLVVRLQSPQAMSEFLRSARAR